MKYRLKTEVTIYKGEELGREHWVQRRKTFIFIYWWVNISFSYFKSRENALKEITDLTRLPLQEETVIYKYL